MSLDADSDEDARDAMELDDNTNKASVKGDDSDSDDDYSDSDDDYDPDNQRTLRILHLKSCHARVNLTERQRTSVIRGKQVVSKAPVTPNCQAYPNIPSFTYKSLKPLTLKYICTNTLVLCPSCEDFVWTFNIKKHFDVLHQGSVPPHLLKLLPTEKEKEHSIKLYRKNTI